MLVLLLVAAAAAYEPGVEISAGRIEWPSKSARHLLRSSGCYEPSHVIATRLQVAGETAFVALPRLKPCVPFSLGCVRLRGGRCAPFPSLEANEEGGRLAVQNAVDIWLEEGLLWVLDSGVVDTLGLRPRRLGPPRLLALDQSSGRVVRDIDLSAAVSRRSCLQHLVVGRAAESGALLAVVGDATEGSLIVVNCESEAVQRLQLPRDVRSSTPATDVLYLSLVRSTVLLTYLSSPGVFQADLDDLLRSPTACSVKPKAAKPQFAAAMVPLGTDRSSRLFFRHLGHGDVFMWNTDGPMDEDNVVMVQKASECRLATQVAPGPGGLMWVIESDLQDYLDDAVGDYGASAMVQPLVRDED